MKDLENDLEEEDDFKVDTGSVDSSLRLQPKRSCTNKKIMDFSCTSDDENSCDQENQA